jgi:hypothetical protein
MEELFNRYSNNIKKWQELNILKKIESIMQKITPIHEEIDNEN